MQSKRPGSEHKSPTEVELTFDGADVKNIGAYREGKERREVRRREKVIGRVGKDRSQKWAFSDEG